MPRTKILFLAMIAAMTSLGIDMSLPGIPWIETNFSAHVGQGVLSSSFFVAGFALMPLAGGPLSDCFGRYRVLVISLVTFGLAALGCAFARSMPALLVMRLMQGCATGIATTLPLAIVGDSLTGDSARQAMSEISALSGFMPILAPAFGNGAVSVGGWRLMFGLQAAFGLTLLFPAMRFPESLAAASRQRFNPRRILKNYRTLIAEPTLMACAVVFGLLFACTFCFTAVSPLILIQRGGMTRANFTVVMAMNAVGSMMGAAASALLSKNRIAGRSIIFAGLTVAAISTMLAAALRWMQFAPVWGLLALIFLALFGFNLAGPSLLLEALKNVPGLLGSGSGLMRSIFMLLNSVSSALLGAYCVRHLPYTERATTLLMASLAMLACVIYGCHARATAARAIPAARFGLGEPEASNGLRKGIGPEL